MLSHAVTIGGHVAIEDWAVVGAGSAIHQFCRIGRHAMIGGYSVITQDVLPFSTTSAKRESKVYGENKTGLERRGFSAEAIESLHKAFRLLSRSKLNTSQALEKIPGGVGRVAGNRRTPPIHRRVEPRLHKIAMPYGLIAGNGRFPVLALEAAKKAGLEVVAIGIKEEASPEIEPLAARCHWISLGALNKLIDICHREGITQVMMCGQGETRQDFLLSIVPDLKLVKMLASIETKNTEGLIGGVDEGASKTKALS